jgi:hypothetical protein
MLPELIVGWFVSGVFVGEEKRQSSRQALLNQLTPATHTFLVQRE